MNTLEASMTADLVRVMDQIIENLHLADLEAQKIADRISSPHGQCPESVDVLEDAEKLIKATVARIINGDE